MDIDFLKLFQESKSHLELGMSKDIQAFFEGRGDVKNSTIEINAEEIVFINIEIKVQAEVIDGKIDWESATILTIYDEKIFFSIYDKITDRTVYFQY